MAKSSVSGEGKLFLSLWFTRPQVSFLSGRRLLPPTHPRFYHQFAHIFGKGRHPDLRLEEWNIILILPDEHYAMDFYDEARKRRLHPECDWDKLDRLKEGLREDHHFT